MERPDADLSELLRVETLTCRYGARTAVEQVDLRLDRGQRVALLGANGAGKSTLMRAIAGRLPIAAGRIRVGGHEAGSADARALVGVIPQGLALFPRLSARENLRAFAELSGVARGAVDDAVQRSLDWADLSDRSEDLVTALSGGMQRRLSVACGAVHQPALLLADEPLVGVDAQRREPIEALLNELCQAGTTLVESTHDLSRVTERFDTIVVMAAGRVVATGEPRELLARAGLAHECRITLEDDRAELAPPPRFERSGAILRGPLGDVAEELPALLGAIQAAGHAVREVHVSPPAIEELIQHLGEGAREASA